ncbi:glycosyltransferase family 2 protein [Paragemmobacter ruber]|uniref:Glycosyltransferase n=1 Tax=Paragemmobacter ruber TaxID=1985673 RepID=A0ABW9Y224_9RHOB|nr:glycosyltransferase family A protein [Rhodobacter ruber]NBE06557.1 glycosyltransferase [Rhodobacter ruber]
MKQPDPEPAAPALSVIIAARNEAAYIDRCLQALAAQEDVAGGVQVVVAANACTDATVALARAHAPAFAARGWTLAVLDLPQGGKLGALAAGEVAATGRALAYLDADVICDPPLLGQLARALDTPAPRYATGTLAVTRARSAITRAYARIWTRLPFVQGGAVGAGLFAMNRAGRARWGDWPAIISDDTFARLHFTPAERIEVPARYHWPMVEGMANLIRVRRRQDAGVHQIARLYPDLPRNESKAPLTRAHLLRLALTDPLGLATYLTVHVAVRLRPASADWTRGR